MNPSLHPPHTDQILDEPDQSRLGQVELYGRRNALRLPSRYSSLLPGYFFRLSVNRCSLLPSALLNSFGASPPIDG